MVRDFTATLLTKVNMAGDVWRFVFRVEGEPLIFAPGQYVLLKIESAFRQYSISSSPTDGTTFELIVEYIPGGLASTYLGALGVGDSASFKGPAGIFILRHTEKPKIFLATGTGIAPVKSMVISALENNIGESVKVFFGLKTRDDVYLEDDFKALAQEHSQFDYTICLSREDSPEGLDAHHVALGRVNMALDAYFDDSGEKRDDFEYYLCGSKTIVQSLKEYCLEKGVSKENIFQEMFG